jgi:hypothetical protein
LITHWPKRSRRPFHQGLPSAESPAIFRRDGARCLDGEPCAVDGNKNSILSDKLRVKNQTFSNLSARKSMSQACKVGKTDADCKNL